MSAEPRKRQQTAKACLTEEEGTSISQARKTVQLALLASAGLVLFVFESYVPRPVPWVKVGLGNVLTLLGLIVFGPREAILLTVVRTTLGPLILGTLLTPAFVFSFGGGLCSAGTMIAIRQRWGGAFSIVGLSIWGALAHNSAQMALAYLLFVRSLGMAALLWLVPGLSVVTGAVTGLVAQWCVRKVVDKWRPNDA